MITVLIIDDELAIAEALALILTDEGYTVICASNGRLGLEQMALKQPDIVILDFVMPVMTGADFGHAVRELYPDRCFRIVMNSSIAEEQVRQSFDGYDVFIRKPYTIKQLLTALEAQKQFLMR